MILNKNKDNSKSSTKFFMKENNKDEGVSCLDGIYDVPRKEENVLGKKIKENSEIKVKSQRRKSGGVGKTGQERRILSFSNIWVVCAQQHISLHFLYPMVSGGSSPFFGEEVMAITSEGDARTQLPPKIF